ncbi:Flp family type IVb pilin [Duganella sp. FT27W]|uniref:Flp family type IVb pilin n=1 Tax=Duganella sp. FT27W TaxID=2654636 RepID=UPI00128BE79B|nr:Flp family type IVb pilin [Duganella sp. FT27W]MPQ57240.1 Flp family type IVb pilin [Duganella sp. FT27W]
MNSIKNFIKDESGVTAIEYALIAALIGVVAAVLMNTIGGNVKAFFQKVANGTAATPT